MINSIWETSDGKHFQIYEIKIIGESVWVYYKNIQTKQEYHCLLDYFKHKFWENNNARE